jgi:serine/threonine protein kinase
VKVKEALLGRGFYGAVYKVDSKTAVKVQLLSEGVFNDIDTHLGIKHRIAIEKEISIKAGELGVGPKVYDSYVCCGKDNGCYMVMYMEYVKGETLEQLENTPGKEAAVEEAKELAKAKLQILHKHKILHGDVHRGNIWVSKSKSGKLDVKLIDYGYARYFRDGAKIASNIELQRFDVKTPSELRRYVAVRLVEAGNVVA